MTYRLLSTGKGVITTRQVKVIKDNATFLFNGAPEGAMAVFTMPGATYYRELNGGRCNIPGKYLDGNIAVSIALNDKTAKIKRYSCEGLQATKLSDGVLLAPDDSNLAEEFAKSKVEMDELREDITALEKKIADITSAFEKMKEGYGLV
jgi:hypothetical protein